jgi:hypothetical protein
MHSKMTIRNLGKKTPRPDLAMLGVLKDKHDGHELGDETWQIDEGIKEIDLL